MEERDTGLVLRTRLLTETSLIVHWLTANSGRLSTVAKGARRPRSPFRGKLDLFFLAELSFSRSRKTDLHTLREVVLRDTHPALRQDIGWLEQAAYAASLVEFVTESDSAVPELFELTLNFVRHLPGQPKTSRSVLAFEIKLLATQGWQPNWSSESLSAGTRSLLDAMRRLDWAQIGQLRLSQAQSDEATRFLRQFMGRCFERVPPKREAALA